MEFGRRLFSLLKTSKKEDEELFLSAGNTSAQLEELIASSNGGQGIPIRRFTAKELIKATNNFKEIVGYTGNCHIFTGSFDKSPILVKKFREFSPDRSLSGAIRDIVITSRMSQHKNVLKLLGFSIEFKIPVLVYECAWTKVEQLPNLLYPRPKTAFRWKNRLRIATDIGNAIAYLHTAFPAPIVYRDLNPQNIVIDQDGVAKLLEFSLSTSIPPGESSVEDCVVGTTGYGDPEYTITGIITLKTDVYMFGMLLLVLLTGKKPLDPYSGSLKDCVKDHVKNNRFNKILDDTILAEDGGIRKEQQLQASVALALRCVENKGENRPELVEVVEKLRWIERYSN
ncbi:unnamed protein product [Ilex paraguariensis]|uniref:Protein kinase domain-containing protein n=1 Tax=Ilex paraguariensis TaxID=185542 RepID=A0ABC8T5L3_9AQUA